MDQDQRTEAFHFRSIRPEETDQAVEIEQICFPPHEACSADMMRERIERAPELFLVAVDVSKGKLAGFLCGLSTFETVLTDDFFRHADRYDPAGDTVMLLGLDVLPAYRHQGLARALMRRYQETQRLQGRKRLVLTCHDDKISLYEKMGFEDGGLSVSTWGGEAWHEMACNL